MDLDPRVETTTLDNGLTVTTVPLPHVHTAVCGLSVRVGSRFEAPADNGLSHFVEHMLYRGTKRYPTSLALNTAVERLGSTLHAETGRHDSLFQLSLEPTNVPAGIELLGELLHQPRFSDIDLERELILEEISEDYDEHGVEINSDDIARGMAFAKHPLGQRIIGPLKNVRRFSTADVRRHFKTFYGARNASLCVAGPVHHKKVVDAAARAFAPVREGKRIAFDPAPAVVTHRQLKHIPDRGPQVSLSILFRGLPESDPDHVAQSALLRVLDDGMSTRLHYTIADQKGLSYGIHAGIEPLVDTAVFEITGATANAKLPTLVKEILKLLDGLRAGEISADELARVRVRYRYDTLAAIDDAGAMASVYGTSALFSPPVSLKKRLAQMTAIKIDDVVRVAERVLTPDHLVVAAVGTISRVRLRELRGVVDDWS